MDLQTILAIISVFIIIGLAFYAGMLINRIKRQKALIEQQQLQQKEQEQQKRAERNDSLCHSIRFIAKATTQKQCNVSEAAIRLTVLLETLLIEKPIDIEKQYPALFAMFEKVKDMPTHEKRKKVPKKELRKLDMQREVFEAEMEDKVIQDAEKLQTFSI